jgi:putative transposase
VAVASAVEITLSEEERFELERQAGRLTLPYRDVQRAKVVLYAAAGLSNVEIAGRLEMCSKSLSALARAVMDRMLAGASTRKFAQVSEPVGSDVEQSSVATLKTSVSELFVERTATALGELMGRRLDDVRLAVMMLDGLEIADRTHVVALGITTDGVKIPLGLWEGSTENATLARTLLADLVDRGLDPEQQVLFVIDGGKALRRAIKDVFGEHALVHRCHRHYADSAVMPTRARWARGDRGLRVMLSA